MSDLRLSVVVVSVGRPDALRRCLLGLAQQKTAGCEVVVVADAQGQAAVRTLPVTGALKVLPQSVPNISAARNAGIAAAAGDIIAFIDDDAVPEPTWSEAVLAAFGTREITAITGPVLGRNGISLQWGPMAVNEVAQDLKIQPNTPIRVGFHRKLQGTNMALRRSAFEQIGGFDEALHFYLDDTDMALRIGQAGLRSKWAPGAVVHHGFAASSRRTKARIPLTLFDIGASLAVFLRKHADPQAHKGALLALEAAQSTRLLRMTRRRELDVAGMRGLMNSLREGIEEGHTRPVFMPNIEPNKGEFDPFQYANPADHKVLSGRFFQRGKLRKSAQDFVAQGHPVSLFMFEPTPRKHRVEFTDGGWWEQTGGLYGPADRSEKRLQLWAFNSRLTQECRRISATRGLDTNGDVS